MMRKGFFRVALMMSLATFGVAPLAAADAAGPEDDATHEVRVINNYQSPVRVYVQDAEGHLHALGRVSRGRFKVLEFSNEIAEMGDVRLKIYPDEPVGSLTGNSNGIKTKELSVTEGDAVTVWLETDLTQSMIQVEKG